ncbi:MAG TPA: hypothetical protein VFQ53_15015 [Kofleriaceae bacterium]|nr:hypothetical protein [Kofleriaceae bacterium]
MSDDPEDPRVLVFGVAGARSHVAVAWVAIAFAALLAAMIVRVWV